MYDMTTISSFASVPTWLKDLKETCNPNIVILLVGNKSDLKDDKAVPTEDARLFAGLCMSVCVYMCVRVLCVECIVCGNCVRVYVGEVL